MSAPKKSGSGHGAIPRTRGGKLLTKEEVREIKAGRKRIRKEMKKAGIYNKDEFEMTASSMGLYFDKPMSILAWLLHGKGIFVVLGAALVLLAALLAMAKVSEMRGYFTINMTDDMFRNGFVLSETEDFSRPATNLFCEPHADIPCISIMDIDADVDAGEGQHDSPSYFAYSFYIRNEGEDTVDFRWKLQVTGESSNVSAAVWVMVIEDGQMRLYAKAGEDGLSQTLPARDDDSRGYTQIPVMALADPTQTFLETVKTVGTIDYLRVITLPFESEDVIASGMQTEVAPMDVHKYTVVIWLEGDDPDCTNELIGGHMGLGFQFEMLEE